MFRDLCFSYFDTSDVYAILYGYSDFYPYFIPHINLLSTRYFHKPDLINGKFHLGAAAPSSFTFVKHNTIEYQALQTEENSWSIRFSISHVQSFFQRRLEFCDPCYSFRLTWPSWSTISYACCFSVRSWDSNLILQV